MSYQITKVDLIPNGEIITCNASQFDNGRVLPFEIYENKVAYNIPNDVRVELHCRKPDGNIVTLPSNTITDNIVTFITTTQLTACYGDNVCEISLYGADDYLIGSSNFTLEVEKSPTYGGINSTSAIHNLERQIRGIAEDVIPEILPEYLEDYYTKSEIDIALALKANSADVYTKEQTYTQSEVNALIDNIFPTFTASGAIASFVTALTKPLVSVTIDDAATMITRCGKNLFDFENWIRSKNVNYTKDGNKYTFNIMGTLYTQPFVFSDVDVPVTLSGNIVNLTSVVGRLELLNVNNQLVTRLDEGRSYISGTGSKIRMNYTTSGSISIEAPQVELGNTASEYHAYNGQTVPVSESSTLVTLSGVNNVFADVGDVTVQYKYMPMPETQTNLNRLTLSSVNSDIIKEKSEIKDQSDIIEDIERGEENE